VGTAFQESVFIRVHLWPSLGSKPCSNERGEHCTAAGKRGRGHSSALIGVNRRTHVWRSWRPLREDQNAGARTHAAADSKQPIVLRRFCVSAVKAVPPCKTRAATLRTLGGSWRPWAVPHPIPQKTARSLIRTGFERQSPVALFSTRHNGSRATVASRFACPGGYSPFPICVTGPTMTSTMRSGLSHSRATLCTSSAVTASMLSAYVTR
jgi:hypothetical protein